MTPADCERRMKALQSKWGKYYGRDRMLEDIVDFYHLLLSSIADQKCQSVANCAEVALRVEDALEGKTK